MEKTGSRIFWLYFLAVSVWIVLYLIANNKADWDLWGVMSFGALLDQNPHFFPYQDLFSYTALGHRWIYHEWGSGVIFYQLFRHFGSGALFALKLVLVEAVFLLACQRVLRKRPDASDPASSSSPLADWLLPLCLPVTAYLLLPIVSTTIRCQLFTFLGYALFLMILERHKHQAGYRGVWLLPVLMIAWVNLHGGFITGLVAIGAYLLHDWLHDNRQSAKQLAVVFALSSLAMLVNPYGLMFIKTMIAAWSLPRAEISEWGNVMTLDIPGYGLLYSILLLGCMGLGFWQYRQDSKRFSGPLLLLLFAGFYGWLHYKLAPLFLITLLSVGAECLPPQAPWLERWKQWGQKWLATLEGRALRNALAYGVPAVLMLVGIGVTALFVQTHAHPWIVQVQGAETMQSGKRMTRFAYPIGVVNFLRDNRIQANVWTPFAWGEFLYWTLYPNVHVSIDGRYETVYPTAVFNAYYVFYHAPYRLSAALDFPTTHILIPRRRKELKAQLDKSKAWHIIYQDAMSLLYSRVLTPPSQHLHYSSISRPMDEFMGDPVRFRLPDESLP